MHAYHCRRACFRVLHILFLFDLGGRGPGGGHHKNDNIITFWCNSSGTHVTTFTLDYCDIVPCPFDPSWWCHWYSDIPDGKDIYVCHTDSYWGQSCGFCGGQWVGTQGQTGRPQSALDKKDENRKPPYPNQRYPWYMHWPSTQSEEEASSSLRKLWSSCIHTCHRGYKGGPWWV